MFIDGSGFEVNSPSFIGNKRTSPSPYIVSEKGTATPKVTYVCFSSDPLRVIQRITVSGVTIGSEDWTETKIEFSYGAWEDRETLNYVPINEVIEVV